MNKILNQYSNAWFRYIQSLSRWLGQPPRLIQFYIQRTIKLDDCLPVLVLAFLAKKSLPRISPHDNKLFHTTQSVIVIDCIISKLGLKVSFCPFKSILNSAKFFMEPAQACHKQIVPWKVCAASLPRQGSTEPVMGFSVPAQALWASSGPVSTRSGSLCTRLGPLWASRKDWT